MESKSFFQLDKAFFVMDSESLDSVQTAFYGYTILDGAIVETPEALENAELTGDGAYVYIRRMENSIRINQDFMGSYGLYLYRDGDYFAISNSFLYLVEYLKQKRTLTFNHRYAGAFLATELCVTAYSDTMVEEITLLDRCVALDIQIPSRQLSITYEDYHENTVSISSPEGMEILDSWLEKWKTLFTNIRRETSNIQVDLSGGFDTRMTFALLMGTGIDPNGIRVYSSDDNLHTHGEDFAIASAIAKHYGFRLNNEDVISQNKIPNTMEDIIDISFYSKLCFHKQMYYSRWHHPTPFYYIAGSGGECVRGYWAMTQEAFIEKSVKRCRRFPENIAPVLAEAVRETLVRSFREIQEKYARFGREIAPEDMTLNLGRETQCRSHFGKNTVESYLRGSYKLNPLLDPQLHKLRLYDEVCSDTHLLMSVILTRFAPDLLEFGFDGNRSLDARTLLYAKELCCRYPYGGRVESGRRFNPVTPPVHQDNGEIIPLEEVRGYISRLFRLPENADGFAEVFGEKTYAYICRDMAERSYFALQDAYAILGVSKILRDTRCSRDMTCQTFGRVLRHQLDHSGESRTDLPAFEKYPWLEHYITARVDLKNGPDEGNDVVVLQRTDPDARVTKPKWMVSNGNGCVIESQRGALEVEFRCVGDGTLNIALRSRDVRDSQKKRIPFWLDFDLVRLNGEDIIREPRSIWHDVPLKINRQVRDGEVLRLELRWAPRDPRKN